MLINKSFAVSTYYPESEDEQQPPTSAFHKSKEAARPLLRPGHIRSQSQADTKTLNQQHRRREFFVSRARAIKRPIFNRRPCYDLKLDFSFWKIVIEITPDSKYSPFESDYSSTNLMTLNPLAPTFPPQQRLRPYLSDRPITDVEMEPPEATELPTNSTKLSCSLKACLPDWRANPILKCRNESSPGILWIFFFQQTTQPLQKFTLGYLKHVQCLHAVQLTVAQLHQILERESRAANFTALGVSTAERCLFFVKKILRVKTLKPPRSHFPLTHSVLVQGQTLQHSKPMNVRRHQPHNLS